MTTTAQQSTRSMQAVTYERYGDTDVLQLDSVARPVPGENDVLIRVHAAAVTTADCTARSGRPKFARIAFGPLRPKHRILGTEYAGVVEEVGARDSWLSPGDRVFGATGDRFGAHAEYLCVPHDSAIAPCPSNHSFEESVAIAEGSLTALPFLRDLGKIRAGHEVLINGASGAVGTAAVQLAKHFGATVTGVCGPTHVDLVRSLGADAVIDYSTTDFAEAGGRWDIVFDAVGKSSYRKSRSALQKHGIYLTTVPSLAIFPQMLWTSRFGRYRAAIAFTGLRKPSARATDLCLVKGLAEDNVLRPVVDCTFRLDAISDAHRRVETGHKHGSVVLSIA